MTPRTRRSFARGERAAAFVRAYQSRIRGLSAVNIAARIQDDEEHIVFQQTTSIRPGEFAANRSADYVLDLPLTELKPGEHLLTIEAMAGVSQVRRDLRFTVR